MTIYNGHKNWNHWNVSLWINNDPGLYYAALAWVRTESNRDTAARGFLNELLSGEIYGKPVNKTPDGAPFSLSSIRAAFRDI